ncbi:MAG TPA: histidinol-phosphate transaminase [Solirubrobacteraceae bacterium]|nr:histidinol-phosphate transaminase [Solirubrobacteraceae bacterium]
MTLARLNLSEGTVLSSGCLDAVAAETAAINLYPDPDCEALTCALAEHWKVQAANIAVGNGSDELILLCALTLGDPSRPGVISAGTFLGHRYALEIARREIREVPLLSGRVDAGLFAKAIPGAGIAFLCTPHNPSGVALADEELELITCAAARAGVPLVVDEAYMEFAPEHVPSLAGTIKRGSSIVALRTFSKAYGLAGVRIGYAIANHADARALRHAQRVLPFRANRLGQVAALAALRDSECIPRIRAETARKKDWFTVALRKQGFEVQESAANFVAVAVTDPPAVARSLLEEHEIAVRDTTSMGYDGHVRISLGTQEELERAVHALVEVQGKLMSDLDRQ